MQLSYRLSALISICILLIICASSAAAQSRPAPAGPKRISFAQAVTMLDGENEGNLSNQPKRYSKTKLRDGRVLETFYPLTTSAGSGKARRITVAGYGIVHESESALREANRPRHMLEDLIPSGDEVIEAVPELVARLEKRLGLGKGRLDYTRSSLRRIDAWLAGYQRSRTTAQTDPRLFQELTAYYGETLRRQINGRWIIHRERVSESYSQPEPNIAQSGSSRQLKPWSSVISALYDEDNRGIGLTRVFDKDLEESRK